MADSACLLDWGKISSSNSSSLRLVNEKDLQPHLVEVTRGAGTKTNSCHRTTSDLSTAAVWPRLERSTKRAYEQQHPQTWPPDPSLVTLGKKKASHVHPWGEIRRVFTDLFCSIKLQFEVPPQLRAKVVILGGGMGPKVKSGASKKQVFTRMAACPSEVIHLFPANSHVSVKKKKVRCLRMGLKSPANDILWLC